MSAAAAPTALVPASDSTLLVRFGNEIGLESHVHVLRLMTALQRLAPPFVRNLHPAYASVLVDFDPALATHAQVQDAVAALFQSLPHVEVPPPRHVEIPVCYAPGFAPDLDEVAALHHMAADEVVALLASTEYRVYFLGFSPGFPYMGGLPARLVTPRLASPRPRVPAGSVAIAGAQVGVYPVDSPGGWRLIGRTPLRLFRPTGSAPTLLQMGDLVRFRRIDFDEFEGIARRVRRP